MANLFNFSCILALQSSPPSYVDCAISPQIIISAISQVLLDCLGHNNSFDIYLSPSFDLHLWAFILLLSNRRRPFITSPKKPFSPHARLGFGEDGETFFTHTARAKTDFSRVAMNNLSIHSVFIPPDGHAQVKAAFTTETCS